MFRALVAVDAVSRSVDWLVTRLVFLLMAGLVICTTSQVIFRLVADALTWSEELSRYLLVWGTFFGATMAYRRGSHIAITFVINCFKPRVRAVFVVLSYLLSMVFFCIVAWYGWQMIKMQIFQISPALSIPMQYVYLSIPISMLIMVIHAAAGIGREIENVRGREMQP